MNYFAFDLARWETDAPVFLWLRYRNTSMSIPMSSGGNAKIAMITGVRQQSGWVPKWKLARWRTIWFERTRNPQQ